MSAQYHLTLFVAGSSTHSVDAQRRAQELCATYLADRCLLEIIDVVEHPQSAEDAKVFATPTLIRREPPPTRKIVGDLSNAAKVLSGLDLAAIDL